MGRRTARGPAAAAVVFASALLLSACVRVGYDALERRDGGALPPRQGAAGGAGVGGDGSLSGKGMEAGVTDAGGDASATPDPLDASTSLDAAGLPAGDAESPIDGSTPDDAGSGADAGSGTDAGPGSDAGPLSDGGASDLVEGANEVTIGSMNFSGSGCSSSNAVADPSDRAMRLHLNFMQFDMQATAGTTASTACAFALPLDVPAGVSLRMVGGSFHGDYNRSANATGRFAADYWFEGDDPRSSLTELGSELGGSFDVDDDVRNTANTAAGWTACSAQARNLVARATLTLSGTNEITFAIRSGDLFRIESRYCTP